MSGPQDEHPPPPPPPQETQQQTPHTVSTIKLPILKKGEYDIWAMKIEHYLAHTDYPIWEVIQNGNGPVSVTLDTTGQIKILPPKTAEEMVLRERERKARTTLLMAIPEDHLAKFHKMTDAKDMWNAIKSRFGGNDESKKMQKYILKQQFEGFTVSNSDGIHKGYERFQSLLSQLEIHGAGVSTEDANQKFLRSLPSAWLQVSLIMRNKPGMDSLSFDDLRDGWNTGNREGRRTGNRDESITGKKEESKALVTVDGESVDWTTHSEDDDNYAFMANNSSGSDTQVPSCSNECKESYANIKRLYDTQREQLSDASVEIKAYTQGLKKVEAQLVVHQQNQLWYEQKIKFMKIDLDDKTDVLIYHKKLLAKAQKEKDDLEVIVDKWNHSSKNLGKIINYSMSASDKFGLGYGDYRYSGNLSYENEVFQSVFRCNASDSENPPLHKRLAKTCEMQAVPPPMTGNYLPSGPDIEIDDSQYTYGPEKTQPSESESQTTELDTCDSNISTEPSELVSEPVVNESNIEVQPKVWSDAPIIEEYESDSDDECVTVQTKGLDTPSFANKQVKTPRENVKNQSTNSQKPKVNHKELGHGITQRGCFVCGSISHLIRDCDYHVKLAKQVELNKQNMSKGNGTGVRKQTWNNVQRVNKQNQFVPLAVQTRTGTNPVNAAKASSTNNFSTARQSVNRQTVLTSTALKVNTVQPMMSDVRSANVFHKTNSPSSRPFKRTTVLKTNLSNQKVYTAKDNPHRTLKNKGIIDSGCSRHMTGNKAYLADYQDINGGPVAFGGSRGYITGKGKIQTGKLDFEDVSFVKELQHFNLFSVSQMCDKKNKVLFTDTECLILSPDFKLPDENQILLKVPRQNNMYSFNLENIVPLGGLACLIAKATTDESNLWHRRLGHVNFKNLNRLVKGNLVRGLPTKLFQNDHTCVACQKGKQHKASCKAKLVSSISHTLQLLHMDLFGPTSVRSINHKTYCLVITDDFSRFSWTFFLRTKDETSAILKDFIRQIENQLNQKVKTIRCDNGTEFKNRDINEFCGLKGIKREYSNARTPQQNGVAERKNRTLIEAARTMLADSFLPNTFWAEAVSTACYVLNRVLVTKPHNKTPYELLTGKTPIISYIRPFGCHVTILNTIDHLGKFAGKSDEGFLVGYSLQSKAFRVYNLVTKRVEENLHIKFLENKPNVAGKGPNWLFDLDYLTDSMNYLSGILTKKMNLLKTVLKFHSGIPILPQTPLLQNQIKREEEQIFLDDLARLQRQEKEANEEAEALTKNLEQDTENAVTQAEAAKTSGTNIISTVSTTAKASGTTLLKPFSIPVRIFMKMLLKLDKFPHQDFNPSHPSTYLLGYPNISRDKQEAKSIRVLKLMLLLVYVQKAKERPSHNGLTSLFYLLVLLSQHEPKTKLMKKYMCLKPPVFQDPKLLRKSTKWLKLCMDTIKLQALRLRTASTPIKTQKLLGLTLCLQSVLVLAGESSFDLKNPLNSDYAGAKLDRKSPTVRLSNSLAEDHNWQCLKESKPIVATCYNEAEICCCCRFASGQTKTINNVKAHNAKELAEVVWVGGGGVGWGVVSDQAKEIKLLKAKITKLKKKATPVIKHFKEYQKRISKDQRQQRKRLSKKKRVQQESVSKQGRKNAKGDGKAKENAQSEGRSKEMMNEDKDFEKVSLSTEDEVSTAKEGVSTDFEKVSTDRPKLSTDDFKVSTDEQMESTDDQVDADEEIFKGAEDQKESDEEQKESTEEQSKEDIASQASQTSSLTPTSVIFGDDETIATLLINMSKAKATSKEKEKKEENEEENETESEDDDIPQAVKKFKQLESDEELARKVQEEWEAEEEKNKIAEEEAANEALINNIDDFKARI
ncbi:putative ribonuclease H-like domain-containing protein [Tanacetum coccineum]